MSRQRFIHADARDAATTAADRPDLHLSLSPNLRPSLSVFLPLQLRLAVSRFHSMIERAFIHSFIRVDCHLWAFWGRLCRMPHGSGGNILSVAASLSLTLLVFLSPS